MKISIDRKVVFLAVFTVAWCAIGASVLFQGWSTTWTALHIPILSPSLPFEDMRTVQGSLRSVEMGLDPQVENPGDPWRRAMNYPTIWYWIARLFQFDHEMNLILFVSAYILAYIVCCFILLRKDPSVYLLLALFSWPSLLAVERGNNDLLAFGLLFAGVTLSVGYLRALFILAATVLKVHPALMVVTLAKKPKILIGLVAIIVTIFIINSGELSIVQGGNTALSDPNSLIASYGLGTTIRSIHNVIPGLSPAMFMTVKTVLVLISILLIVILSRTNDLDREVISARKIDLFISGGVIFAGTFLLTSNWDYRLIFLLLCIPYILSIQNVFAKHSMLIGILLSSNSGFLWANPSPFASLLCALIKYYVFIMVSAYLLKEVLNTLPAVVLDRLQRANIPFFRSNRLKQVSASVLERAGSRNKPWARLQPRRWPGIVVIFAVLIYFSRVAQEYFIPRILRPYGTLTLLITGLRPPGNVMIHVKSADNQNFSRNVYMAFDRTEMTYSVEALYQGNYVIQVIHDENSNEVADLDSATGLFREGFGMANMDKLDLQNAEAVEEGVTSDNLKVTFDQRKETVEIKMYYPPFPWQNQ